MNFFDVNIIFKEFKKEIHSPLKLEVKQLKIIQVKQQQNGSC